METITTPVPLPVNFQWILKENNPWVIQELLKYYGLTEVAGAGNNSTIMQWAKELGLQKAYSNDAIPWCALCANYMLWKKGYPIPKGEALLGAANILDVPGYIHVPAGQEMYGDILVYERKGGHHEAFYVGENKNNFLNFGGNQSDRVGFAFIDKTRRIGARRPNYNSYKPFKKYLTFDGKVSTNEA